MSSNSQFLTQIRHCFFWEACVLGDTRIATSWSHSHSSVHSFSLWTGLLPASWLNSGQVPPRGAATTVAPQGVAFSAPGLITLSVKIPGCVTWERRCSCWALTTVFLKSYGCRDTFHLLFELRCGTVMWGFPGGSAVKEPAYQCKRYGFAPWVRKIPKRRK